MEVIARDREGNEFRKSIEIIEGWPNRDKVIVSFGWPSEYYFEDLESHYPYQKDYCIDMGGLNHKGIPDVSIGADDMDRVVEYVRKETHKCPTPTKTN